MSGPAPKGAELPADWTDRQLVRQWAAGDRLEPLLDLPRRMTADLFAADPHPVRTIVDVGSGPGGFLAVLLDRLPEARGVWTDVSEEMRGLAVDRLEPYAGRVDFRLLGAGDLSRVAGPGEVDAVVSSRVSHHLDTDELARFYADARLLLRDGGWIANLDHVAVPEPWGALLTQARAAAFPPNPARHRHDRPHPSLDDHLGALRRAGGLDVVVAWRAYATVLLLARRRP